MATETKQRYIEAVGRRKTAIARVRITPSTKTTFVVNDKDVKEYFVTEELQMIAQEAIGKSEVGEKFTVTVHVLGGGIHAQAEAVRHGLSRTLVERDKTLRTL
jgi:small subunit ribosomal protein S9